MSKRIFAGDLIAGALGAGAAPASAALSECPSGKVRLVKDAYDGGSCYAMNSYTDNYDVGGWFNDQASSWRTTGGC
ncbi:hypothetical protein MHY29_05355 [Micrococcus sp. ACRRV]|uniref:hypothetical protein n=1 Tax=Micrococcus sp. ACRRV TaxID=2918203 RepID=UPI001EF2A651|nr:hypothetical protein [Micrococcus sp. ACRRV]MCG7422262.1 hypothetical protein [Micrococcus sp. ACRRV]